ncbi:MAG: Gfo/Idh/MocA family oxidoreductase [Bacteroidales bacterium]|nr:Gfo/Idh/MocA family oxidoreductase [Bacteroidales bacterium]
MIEKDLEQNKPKETPSKSRREALKTMLTLPVVGALGVGVLKKVLKEHDLRKKRNLFAFENKPKLPQDVVGKEIRLGIIGFGIRGKQLLQGLGFVEPKVIDEMALKSKMDSKDTRLQLFREQDDLNVIINGVCDIFDPYGEAAVEAGANIHRQGTDGKMGKEPVRYRTYQELIAADDIDAVIIASPDHWHGQMTIDAALAGKHVYLEKPFTWTVPETYRVRDVVKKTGIVFQLGHQGRQTDSYIRAREIIDLGLLGKVSLIEVCTNRNTPNGAWVYPIIEGSSPDTIDWKQFEGPIEQIKEYEAYMKANKLDHFMGPDARNHFSLERFFRWRCWWDYSTGLSGDLLTHEYDAINQMLEVGIPSSVVSSGGIYVFPDGRTVPDVVQTVMEFRDKEITMLYSATQGNSRRRGKVIMGRDASLEVSSTLLMTADPASVRYEQQINEGVIKTDEPFYSYIPGSNKVDAVTSATELYFAQRGLLYTYVGGKRYDTTHLHLREWLYCIRNNQTPSCHIDASFEEAMTAHMGTRAYLEGRTMYWDKEREEITRG